VWREGFAGGIKLRRGVGGTWGYRDGGPEGRVKGRVRGQKKKLEKRTLFSAQGEKEDVRASGGLAKGDAELLDLQQKKSHRSERASSSSERTGKGLSLCDTREALQEGGRRGACFTDQIQDICTGRKEDWEVRPISMRGGMAAFG